ncbi:MAG: hypothetical protein HRU38_10935 [Saccharospirillaceae bacterium]|nr:hypothetical protein [Saccharospirillaceae bacterium]
MASWTKKTKWCLSHENFTFNYDTATELGKMVGESGCNMPNPFDPDCTDFDDFTDAKLSISNGK